MLNNEFNFFEDKLGLFNALVQHMRAGHCCDELDDERLFPNQILRLVGKVQIVVDEVYAGDYERFNTIMFTRILVATIEKDDPLLDIENWLNAELGESLKIYEQKPDGWFKNLFRKTAQRKT